jgi:hypothetical protein
VKLFENTVNRYYTAGISSTKVMVCLADHVLWKTPGVGFELQILGVFDNFQQL